MVEVKICGLKEPGRVEDACRLGADYVGFVFFPPSRRSVQPHEAARLARHVADGVRTVGLFVNPDDRLLDQVLSAVPLDIVQLHGEESPERVAEIGLRYEVRTMKALPIAVPDDLARLHAYEETADQLLFDAKPVPGAVLPGGNGVAFDWHVLDGVRPARPWLLAGGLHAGNVARALELTGAPGIDVSSGVEIEPGVKDPAKLAALIAAAKSFRRIAA